MQRQFSANEGFAGKIHDAECNETVQEQEMAGLRGQCVGRVCGQMNGDCAERRQNPAGMGDGPPKAVRRTSMGNDGNIGRACLRPVTDPRCRDVGVAMPKESA